MKLCLFFSFLFAIAQCAEEAFTYRDFIEAQKSGVVSIFKNNPEVSAAFVGVGDDLVWDVAECSVINLNVRLAILVNNEQGERRLLCCDGTNRQGYLCAQRRRLRDQFYLVRYCFVLQDESLDLLSSAGTCDETIDFSFPPPSGDVVYVEVEDSGTEDNE